MATREQAKGHSLRKCLSCAWVIEIVYWDATVSLNPVEMTEQMVYATATGTTFG